MSSFSENDEDLIVNAAAWLTFAPSTPNAKESAIAPATFSTNPLLSVANSPHLSGLIPSDHQGNNLTVLARW
jgi:hypothetical protein